jgi:hypothetical protein
MPLNFLIALDLLYREIGWAFLAGLAISILLIPLNKWIASKIGTFSNKMMQMKDARMKLGEPKFEKIGIIQKIYNLITNIPFPFKY